MKERAQVPWRVPIEEVQKHMGTPVFGETDWQLVREVPNGLPGRAPEPDRGKFIRCQRGRPTEVLHLLALCPQPAKLRLREHGIQEHEALDGPRECDRLAVPVVGFVDDGVEPLRVDVKDPGLAVGGRVRRGYFPSDQGGEEVDDLLTVGDSRIRAVLSSHAYPRMKHHGHEEAGLATGIPFPLYGSHSLLRTHESSSSASRGSTPRPLRPEPETPPTLAPTARYRENPEAALAAACAPR